jgi:hypothetical protein
MSICCPTAARIGRDVLMVAGIAATLAAGALAADANADANAVEVIYLDWTRLPLHLCLCGHQSPFAKVKAPASPVSSNGDEIGCLGRWHLKCQQVRTMAGEVVAGQSCGFDKGRWPVRCSGDRAGFWAAPLARSGPSRGFPCQIRRGPETLGLTAAPRVLCLSRQPAGVGAAVAGAEACAPWRRCVRPRGPP